jgi:hypothetical protein
MANRLELSLFDHRQAAKTGRKRPFCPKKYGFGHGNWSKTHGNPSGSAASRPNLTATRP